MSTQTIFQMNSTADCSGLKCLSEMIQYQDWHTRVFYLHDIFYTALETACVINSKKKLPASQL